MSPLTGPVEKEGAPAALLFYTRDYIFARTHTKTRMQREEPESHIFCDDEGTFSVVRTTTRRLLPRFEHTTIIQDVIRRRTFTFYFFHKIVLRVFC